MNTTKENLCKIEIDFFQNTENQCIERVLRFDGKEMLRDSVPAELLKSLDDEVMKVFKRFDPEGQLLRNQSKCRCDSSGYRSDVSDMLRELRLQLSKL